MAILEDLVSILVAAGVGTLGTSIFASAKAGVPTGDGPYLALAVTGGTTPDWTQELAGPAYRKPGFQVRVHAKDSATAFTMANAAYAALFAVRNQTVNSNWFRAITPLQEPNESMGVDELSREQVVFNGLCDKR